MIEYDISALSIAQRKMLVLATSITSVPRPLSTAFLIQSRSHGPDRAELSEASTTPGGSVTTSSDVGPLWLSTVETPSFRSAGSSTRTT